MKKIERTEVPSNIVMSFLHTDDMYVYVSDEMYKVITDQFGNTPAEDVLMYKVTILENLTSSVHDAIIDMRLDTLNQVEQVGNILIVPEYWLQDVREFLQGIRITEGTLTKVGLEYQAALWE